MVLKTALREQGVRKIITEKTQQEHRVYGQRRNTRETNYSEAALEGLKRELEGICLALLWRTGKNILRTGGN